MYTLKGFSTATRTICTPEGFYQSNNRCLSGYIVQVVLILFLVKS